MSLAMMTAYELMERFFLKNRHPEHHVSINLLYTAAPYSAARE